MARTASLFSRDAVRRLLNRAASPTADSILMESLEGRKLFSVPPPPGFTVWLTDAYMNGSTLTQKVNQGDATQKDDTGTITYTYAPGSFLDSSGHFLTDVVLSAHGKYAIYEPSATSELSAANTAIMDNATYHDGPTLTMAVRDAANTGHTSPSYEPSVEQFAYQHGPVIAFEDGTDADYNDAYTPIEVTPGKPCDCENTSSKAITYDSGTVDMSKTDLSSDGFGLQWGVTRSWSNSPNVAFANNNGGNGVVISQAPSLVALGSSVQIIHNGTGALWFGPDGSGGYAPDFGATDSLVASGSGSSSLFTWSDPQGNVTTFYGTDPSIAAGRQGQFKSYVGAGGQTALASYNGSDQLSVITLSDPTTGVTETFTYSYLSAGVNAGKISSIAQQRSTDLSAYRTISYTYYDGTTSNGNVGDLELAVVTDGSANTLSTDYYRYYAPQAVSSLTYSSSTHLATATLSNHNFKVGDTITINGAAQAEYNQIATITAVTTNTFSFALPAGTPATATGSITVLANGYMGGLKYHFNNDDYNRLATAVGTPLTATDVQIAPYASNFYKYDRQQSVIQETAQGSGPSGLGTYSYSYHNSENTQGANSWDVKTVETLPNGSTNTVYSNGFGQQMLKVYTDATTGLQWGWFTAYDSNDNVILTAGPSAVLLPTSLSTLEAYTDLLHQTGTSSAGYPLYQYLSDSSGLINLTDWGSSTTATSSTAGNVAGYVQDTKIENGDTGTPILQNSEDYFAISSGSTTIYPTADSTQYRNTNGTGGQTTSYAYNSYYSGTVQEKSVTTTLPVVTTAENGPNSSDVSTDIYDIDGRVIWSMDGGGFITFNAYDASTGALLKTIRDVDTSITSDYDTTTLPTGWATPSGGGANLVTTYTVDSLGRTTESVSPSPGGNITYTTYDDVNQMTRVYPGWHLDSVSGLWTTTGPVQVTRQDLSGSYSEQLTYAYTPVSGVTVPTGADTIASLQTLSRTLMNSAGQTVESDAYFNLSGITYSTSAYLGSVNVNYYATTYGYDASGNQSRVVAPTGTITRTVFDGQNRAVGTWVGTNDTPTSGDWSPLNNTGSANMVRVTSMVYDNGLVGDGNVTSSVQYPGGTSARVAQSLYDWRDRLISQKQGVSVSNSLTDADIASPTLAGNATFDGTTYTVSGSGNDFWGTTDQFNFASQSVSGNAAIVARMGSLSANSSGPKAGVMFRTDSTAGSAFAGVVVQNRTSVAFQWRSASGASASATTISGSFAQVWLKVTRVGDSFAGYYSTDGTTWTQIGTAQSVAMSSAALGGLAITSRSNSQLATATFTSYAVTALPLPSGWSDGDIGSPGVLGAAVYDGTTVTMGGGGANITGTSDQFNFADKSFSGNGSIIARVTSQTATDVWAKAGVMFRDSSAANAINAGVFITPSNGVTFQWRTSSGGTTSAATTSAITAPIWLKLTRTGNSFSAYYSSDGTTWTQVGSAQTVTMATAALTGLAVTSHNNALLSRVTFTNVSIGGTAIALAPVAATSDGTHRPLSVLTLDNLGETTASSQYDGDTIAMTDANVDGVPDALDATQLRAYSTTAFDEQGRAYQSKTFSVDPNVGTVSSSALTNNTFYDQRGQTIAQSSPQGVWSKSAYDGAGRVIRQYTTDGGALAGAAVNWTNAGTVANDVVLNQGDVTYDGDGNAILSVDRERFHDDAQTGSTAVGALGDSTGAGGPNARVSYNAMYYDNADRPIADETVGTNGGIAWTRPTTPDAADDTHLVSQTTYNAAGWTDTVTDPRGIKAKTFYDGLGRTTRTVSAWDGTTDESTTTPTVSASNNQVTDFTYDGDSHVLTQKAWNQSGTNAATFQTTGYIYGTDSSSGLFSNDVLVKTESPDKTTGAASTAAADDVTTTYDALGEPKIVTDKNGTVHTFSYDVLGRQTLDAITTLGSGVDGTVRAIGTTYNTQGLVLARTSYSDAAATTPVNTVKDVYNGLGQLTSEAQNHAASTVVSPTLADADLGTVAIAGSASSDGTNFTLSGSGSDIWSTSDNFNFDSQTYSGDGQIVARVTSQAATDGWAKAGVMFRDSSAANAINAALFLSPSNGVTFQWRTTTGGSTSNSAVSGITGPVWLKLTRSGNSFSAFYSVDGVTWTQVGTAHTVTMATGALAGLAVTAHNGALASTATFSNVSIGTAPAAVPTVQYGYSDLAHGSRMTKMIYPNGRVLRYEYSSGIDDSISRVSFLADDNAGSIGTHLEEYKYLGLGTIVEMTRPQNSTKLSYIQQSGDTLFNSDGGDQYTGLDRFGRVVDQWWFTTSGGIPSSTIDRFQYGYDRNGNVLYKNNLGPGTNAASFSELYHANSTTAGDNAAADDSLNRLTGFRRGVLSVSGNNGISSAGFDTVATTNTIAAGSQSWNLDAQGNQTAVTTDGSTTTRSGNNQNEIGTLTTGTTVASVTYDNAGNMLTDGQGDTMTYDAWNRMKSAATSGGVNEAYVYDATGSQSSFSSSTGGPNSDLYHDASGRVIEERNGGMQEQVVLGLSYVNDVVLRDRNTDGNTSTGSLGNNGSGSATGLEERLYFQHDANHNVTSLADTSGTIVMREVYDSYGKDTAIKADFSGMATNAAAIALDSGFQGMRKDLATGFYVTPNRTYLTPLGVWGQQDPAGYVDGANLYQFVGGNAATYNDPSGLEKQVYCFEGFGGFPEKAPHPYGKHNGTDGSSGDFLQRNWKPVVEKDRDAVWHYYPEYSVDEGFKDILAAAKKSHPKDAHGYCYDSIIIMGFSYGGDTAATIVHRLKRENVKVDGVFTADAVSKFLHLVNWSKPDNVTTWKNFYENGDTNYFGIFRGHKVKGADMDSELTSEDFSIFKDSYHGNVEKAYHNAHNNGLVTKALSVLGELEVLLLKTPSGRNSWQSKP